MATKTAEPKDMEPGELPLEEPTPEPEPSLEPRPTQELTVAKKEPLAVNGQGIELTTLDALWRFSKMVLASGMAPKGIGTPEAVAIAIQMGLELGMKPMSALQNIAVINGRPGIFGDAALALVRASGLCEYLRETVEGEGDSRVALCTTKRRGDPEPLVSQFSVADAKRAKLWGKDGPWVQYPDRMLRFRARGFNLRDNFPDVLKGFKTAEEIADYSVDEPEPASTGSLAEDLKADLRKKVSGE